MTATPLPSSWSQRMRLAVTGTLFLGLVVALVHVRLGRIRHGFRLHLQAASNADAGEPLDVVMRALAEKGSQPLFHVLAAGINQERGDTSHFLAVDVIAVEEIERSFRIRSGSGALNDPDEGLDGERLVW